MITSVAVLAAVAAVAAVVITPYLSGSARPARIYVSPGTTNAALADSLSACQSRGFGDRVATLLSLLNVDLSNRIGAYDIAAGDSPLDVARRVRNRQQASIKLTFHNVRTTGQFAEVVAARYLMTKDELMQCLADSAFCASLGKTPATMSAALMPDTYEFYWGVTPQKMLTTIARYASRFWTPERTARAQALGLSPDEVATLASIVEEETAKPDEWGMVARLYVNRLNQGMKLQADPTVKFALGNFALRRITHAMLNTDSPYNTYRCDGLPPGPIRFPDPRVIDAVLSAPAHPYTYMCAKEDFSGYHNFTDSYSTHLRNAARYQAALNSRGIH